MDEYKNAILLLLNSAKKQLTEEEYEQLKAFVREVVKDKMMN